MSEHIEIEAVGLPNGSVQELVSPSLPDGEQPFRQYSQKSWSGNASTLHFYNSGLIKLTLSTRHPAPILIRPGILATETQTQYHLPHVFSLLAIALVIVTGVLYYISLFNEWMLSFCLILALALILSQTMYQITIYSKGRCQVFRLQCWFIYRHRIEEIAGVIRNMTKECSFSRAALPQQIQEHRRLYNEGLITEPEYQAAKAKLFAKKR